MKKNQLFLLIMLISHVIWAQKNEKSTEEVTVFGLIDQTTTLSFAKISEGKVQNLGDFTVTNHVGEFRKAYKNIKGVALLDFLETINITSTSPKLLSEYYFIFRGSDGYSVVFSWNELFNTETGKTLFVVVEADGVKQTESLDRILMITTKDFKTGRRHIKGLKSIEVKKI
jgi:hypothetical protein